MQHSPETPLNPEILTTDTVDPVDSPELNRESLPNPRALSWVKFGAIATLLAAGGSIVAGLWLGLMLLLDPNSILWLNRFLPAWSQVPMALTNPLQTLAEINLGLEAQQLSLGVEFALGDDEVVIPVWQKLAECEGENCQAIASLRVYFVDTDVAGQRKYSLLNEVRFGNMSLGALTEIKPFPVENDSQRWFSVEGTYANSELTAGDRYGVIFHYDAQRKEFNDVLSWQSRAGRSPEWRDVLGDKSPELLIDQSKNLEPEFAVYRLENAKSMLDQPRLVPINLDQAAIALPAYEQAIKWARLRLWALADQRLQEVKASIPESEWSAAAEAQQQFIAYHSDLTTQKCEETTLNIGQKIKYCLQAGDVNEALRLLQNNVDDPLVVAAMVTFLELNGKDLQLRLAALHQLDPFRDAVTIWQFLALTADGGQKTAIANLKKQQQIEPRLQEKITALLGRVEKTLSQQIYPQNSSSKIMGQLVPLYGLQTSDWLQPENQAIALDRNQTWYRLDVSRYFDGQQWQQAPFKLQLSNFVPGQSLWQLLGLDQGDRIEISNPTLEAATSQAFGQVKGAQYKNGQLSLLVQADQSIRGEGLGYTEKTLRWLTPDTMTMQELATLEPVWVEEMMVNLWRHLRASDLRFELNTPPTQQLLEEFGAWQIQVVELTGNNHPEARLTVYLDGKRKLQQPDLLGENLSKLQAHHLIFGDTGVLLYSELSQDGATKLQAIADLQDGGVPALVFKDNNNRYNLKRWNSEQENFN